MKIEEIWIYPIKSCAGYRVAQAELQSTGLKHDRNWMIVDEAGRFVTQRKVPSMARITVRAEPNKLRISYGTKIEELKSKGAPDAKGAKGADDGPSANSAGDQLEYLEVDLDPSPMNPVSVSVWSDTVEAYCYPDSVNAQLSSWLGQAVRLVKIASSSARIREKKDGSGSFAVSFADGYPVLLVNRASHAHLMKVQNLKSPVQRFRANLITTAELPFIEEKWTHVWGDTFQFSDFKPCVRCVMIDVNQLSGIPQRDTLHLLADFRTRNLEDGRVIFGMNMIPSKVGMIREGDQLHAR
jgi:uncharacterized protein YcbX